MIDGWMDDGWMQEPHCINPCMDMGKSQRLKCNLLFKWLMEGENNSWFSLYPYINIWSDLFRMNSLSRSLSLFSCTCATRERKGSNKPGRYAGLCISQAFIVPLEFLVN